MQYPVITYNGKESEKEDICSHIQHFILHCRTTN